MRAPAAVVVGCLLSLVAASAHAAVSVDLVVASESNFVPGGTILLDTYVTSNGGETGNTVFGTLAYDSALVSPNPAGNWQVNLSTVGDANPGWSSNALLCTSTFCVAFNQTKVPPAGTAGLTNFHLARTTFIISPSAPSNSVFAFNWRTTPSTQRLDWFGLTNAPGVTLSIPIPEPGTAALLGAGLLGIALGARRRS